MKSQSQTHLPHWTHFRPYKHDHNHHHRLPLNQVSRLQIRSTIQTTSKPFSIVISVYNTPINVEPICSSHQFRITRISWSLTSWMNQNHQHHYYDFLKKRRKNWRREKKWLLVFGREGRNIRWSICSHPCFLDKSTSAIRHGRRSIFSSSEKYI